MDCTLTITLSGEMSLSVEETKKKYVVLSEYVGEMACW